MSTQGASGSAHALQSPNANLINQIGYRVCGVLLKDRSEPGFGLESFMSRCDIGEPYRDEP